MVLENRLLRRIFGPKREEVAGGWKRQHNEELHNLFASPHIISDQVKERGIAACMGKGKGRCKVVPVL
jgi:hypothetical protein